MHIMSRVFLNNVASEEDVQSRPVHTLDGYLYIMYRILSQPPTKPKAFTSDLFCLSIFLSFVLISPSAAT